MGVGMTWHLCGVRKRTLLLTVSVRAVCDHGCGHDPAFMWSPEEDLRISTLHSLWDVGVEPSPLAAKQVL